MTQESVKVVVRCRPMNCKEKEQKCQSVVRIDSAAGQCALINPADSGAPPKSFTFDGAYDVDSTTEQIYFDIVYPIVESVSEGYNGTVFAYGQTGCGKSFSMQGPRLPKLSKQRGIIPRAFEHIFEAIATSDDSKYLVHASYLEIYNEDIRDLLADDPKKKVDLKEHPDKGVYVPGLSLHPVHDVGSCEAVMERGWKNRSVGATLMNADSSRSHSVFTIHLEQMELTGRKCIRSGKLNLVDLAGSERQAKTGATGERLREATKINLSLSALGNVISALVDGRSKHIPYRDSKLTRLLQDSLGGNTRTLMLACLSPADSNYDETLSTLRYANRAKNIQNRPCVNEDPKDALLREYREELERLKQLLTGRNFLAHNQQSPPPPPPPPDQEQDDYGESNKVMDKLKTQYEDQMQELRNKYLQEQESKAKLQMDVEQLRKHYESQLQGLRQNPPRELNNNELYLVTNEDPSSTPIPSPGPTDLRAPNASPCGDTEKNPATIAQMQARALERLRELQGKMLGGEKKDDAELKEKRAKRRNFAEKRIRALAEALAKVDDEDRTLLPDYEDINAELKVKSSLIKKAKKKIQALEQEVRDLQSEFESDRTDYLETIRKQDQQLRLLGQILEKVQPCIRRDSNYANLETIKAQSVWDQDTQRWRLPELTVQRTKLPPTGIQPGGRAPSNGEVPTIVTNFAEVARDENNLEMQSRSEWVNPANSIFRKVTRQEELLNEQPARLSPSTTAATGTFSSLVRAKHLSTRLAFRTQDDIRTSRSLPNTSTGKNGLSTSPELFQRRPLRLESLNLDEGSGSGSKPLSLGSFHQRPPLRVEPSRSRHFAELLDWPT